MSLFVPALYTSAEDIRGFWILITGWMGLFFFQLAWYANPLNILAFLLVLRHPRLSVLLSLVALFLASETFLFYEIPTGINQEKLYITELGLGFYFWYFAQVMFFITLMMKLLWKSSKDDYSLLP
jgi:hypothetical protein